MQESFSIVLSLPKKFPFDAHKRKLPDAPRIISWRAEERKNPEGLGIILDQEGDKLCLAEARETPVAALLRIGAQGANGHRGVVGRSRACRHVGPLVGVAAIEGEPPMLGRPCLALRRGDRATAGHTPVLGRALIMPREGGKVFHDISKKILHKVFRCFLPE